MTIKYLILFVFTIPLTIAAQQANPWTDLPLKDQHNGKFVLDSTYFFNWDILELNWANAERYKVTGRDPYGNPVSSLTIAYDQQNAAWIDNKRQEYFYYDSISLHYLLAFVWDSKAGNWKLSDSIYYNTNKMPVISWFKVWDASKFRFSRGKKVYYEYTGNNQLIREDIDRFDTLSGNWKTDQLVTYSYNESGLLHQQLTKLWKDDSALEDSLRITYTYNEHNVASEILRESWMEEGFWVNTQRTDQFYNPDGSLKDIFQYAWDSQSQQWNKLNFWHNSYDSQGRLNEVLQQYWDEFTNTWVNRSKITHNFNDQGQRTSTVQQFWETFGNYWYNLSNYTYSYDEDGNRLEFIFQFWDEESAQWLNIYKDVNWWSFFEPASVFETDLLQVSIFPNPAHHLLQITIQEPFSTGELTIYSSSGSPVIRRLLSGPDQVIDVSSLPQGLYILRLTVDGRATTRKVLVL